MPSDETEPPRHRHGRTRGHSAALRRLLRVSSLVLGGFVVAAALNLAFGGGAVAQEGDAPSGDEELIARGAEVFGARCATCHGEEGRGVSRETNPSNYGPSIQGLGPAAFDFAIRTGRMPLEDPREAVRHREPRLTDGERQAVVAWSRTLPGNGPEVPDVDGWEEADLSRGLEQFTTNCAACHGPTGEGIAVGSADFSSPLDEATPLEVAEAIRTGPGVMPVFAEEVMPHDELLATVRWVMDLRDRATPGGASIGRTGPVAEGMLAWILAFGALTVIMYLLGEKTEEEGEEADHAGP